MRILMVEDEIYMAKAVAETIRKHHAAIDLAHDGEYGLACAVSGIYDVIILDIMLPGMDGLTILEEIRRSGITVPVLLLSAKGEMEDKIRGLDLGADDYLAKPFHTKELLARLRALHRRQPVLHNGGILTGGDLQFVPHTLMLHCQDRTAKLTLKEAQIWEMLMRQQDRIVSKNAIIEKVWGYDTEAEDNHVEIHISSLRKKLAQIRTKLLIRTIRGAGYTLTLEEEDHV